MDPVSITASVTALLTLVAQTVKLSKQYVDGVRKSGDTASAFVEELGFLSSSLERLQGFLRKDASRASSFGQTSLLTTRTKATERKIHHIKEKLESVASSRLRQALWPFSEREHGEAMKELRVFSQWIQFSLSIDSSALLLKTSEDVTALLTQQLQSIQQLESIEMSNAATAEHLAMQTDMLSLAREKDDRDKLLAWISDYDQEEKHNEVRASRTENTGNWLFEKEAFRDWYKGTEPGEETFLWCYGNQGSGKSILTSLVIDKIKTDLSSNTEGAAFAYFYFDHRNKDQISPTLVVKSLARQVLSQSPRIPNAIMEQYTESSMSSKPDLKAAENIFLAACSEYSSTFIVLDALDECEEKSHRKVFLQVLDKLRRRADVRVFVTGRHYPMDIQKALSTARQVHVEAHEADLRRYLLQKIDEDPVADMLDEGFKAQLIEKLVGNAQGLFLLPVLQIQMVLSAPTVGEMEEALETLPSSLHEAFDDTLAQIKSLPPGRMQVGIRALMWLFYAMNRRKLRMVDLREALAIRIGQKSTDSRLRPSTEMILNCCRGLVTGTLEPRFIHQAVYEYLQVREKELFPEGEGFAGEMCLTYLLTAPLGEGYCQTEEDLRRRITSVPFLWYAACYGGRHAQQSSKETTVRLIDEFLGSAPVRSCVAQISQYVRGRREEYWSAEEARSYTSLHVAAGAGFEEATRKLLESPGIDVDAATTIGTTALIGASSAGHIKIVRWLLDKGADPTKANWYGSSLHCAANADECEAIEVLLDTGMDIDLQDDFGRTPLDCALTEMNGKAAALLIKRGSEAFSLRPPEASSGQWIDQQLKELQAMLQSSGLGDLSNT